MTPPRRGGKGRGRGRGERRASERDPKKREREARGAKRGGSSASARPTRAVTTVLKKLVVRNIPWSATEQEARALLSSHGVGDEMVWRFVAGRARSGKRPATPARLYLDLKKEPERARKLIAALHGQLFYPEKEGDKPLDVEFAPFQKIPREKQRKDAKVGTIDKDPEYLAFLEELKKPKDKLPSAEAAVDMAEGDAVEKPVAALVEYLNERKAHTREKGKGKSGKALDKNGARRQSRKKDGSKQKGTKDKKSSKDRQKKNTGDGPNSQDSAKPRKQRSGKTASKKESTKPDATEPGMLRIMPKSAPSPGDSATNASPKVNGAPQSADTSSERGSEKRGPKGGKKNGGRGRGGKKPKDAGEEATGEGLDSKPHPRRKSANNGKREPNNSGKRELKKEANSRGERKKKVFAPKDSTAQGTPAKS